MLAGWLAGWSGRGGQKEDFFFHAGVLDWGFKTAAVALLLRVSAAPAAPQDAAVTRSTLSRRSQPHIHPNHFKEPRVNSSAT